MEKRRKPSRKFIGFIFFTAFVTIIIGVIMFIITDDKSDTPFSTSELIFGDNYISYIASNEDIIDMNLWAVQHVNKEDRNLSNDIKDLKLDNDNMKIVDYAIRNEAEHEGKRLIRLDLSVQVNSRELERANQCILTFQNNKEKAFEFGELKVKSVPNMENSDIIVMDGFSVQYEKLDLDGMIKNISRSPIKLNSIYDLGNVIHYELQETKLLPNEEKSLQPSNVYTSQSYDFYSISPILDYTIDGVRKNVYLPNIIYGSNDTDINKIKKIVDH